MGNIKNLQTRPVNNLGTHEDGALTLDERATKEKKAWGTKGLKKKGDGTFVTIDTKPADHIRPGGQWKE